MKINFVSFSDFNSEIEVYDLKKMDLFVYLLVEIIKKGSDKTIKEVCDELGKELKLDIEYEYIEIDFTKEEIDNIKSHYDKNILETMTDFSNLMWFEARGSDKESLFHYCYPSFSVGKMFLSPIQCEILV